MTWFKLFCIVVSKTGWSSDIFSLSRRVRQGCLLFPYLHSFIHSFAEVLDNAVRENENSYGINLAKV